MLDIFIYFIMNSNVLYQSEGGGVPREAYLIPGRGRACVVLGVGMLIVSVVVSVVVCVVSVALLGGSPWWGAQPTRDPPGSHILERLGAAEASKNLPQIDFRINQRVVRKLLHQPYSNRNHAN